MRSRGIRYSNWSACGEGAKLNLFGSKDLGLQGLGQVQITPGCDFRQRAVISHVALERRNRNVTIFNRTIVSAIFRVGTKVLFADPKVRLPAGIDVFGNYRSRVFDPLTRNLDTFDFAKRNINVKERSFW